ncbi:MAG: hypothetical protein A2934_00850 [Candidatus Sungbacteria bacterium RIFCSPLOWO2_01_FULL_47_10]|uniref:50S ribosomal protein L35 n=1 Tax=Candidatus Sungbacteria bacterium RIFCSPLOWO2_01_FULL_47_10 TaxID=1802276 RepID=A0A1G2KZK1_9BACT|nr:MAG: hypothetical protein A2934_00850 [Candidatus Sungbacteria bacterium RIFCSPLOWO2_01_FULL_47_10]
MKPNKSILKRITISKRGKIKKRRAGVNHFNAKHSAKMKGRKHIGTSFTKSFEKKVRQYI